MAYHFLTNQTPFSWADCMGRLIRTMCSAGWQQIAFSNGVTVNNTPIANPYPYSANSNSLGTTTDASSNFNVDRSWICLQQPPIPPSGVTGSYAGVRQIVIQKTTTSNQWRVKYSFSGGYTVPAATGTVRTTPTVNSSINDEVYILGGGTDNVPTFAAAFFNGTEGGARMHYVADDGANVSGSCRSPYGFVMFGYTAGGSNNVEDAFMFDPMLSGTFPDSDPDPYVFYIDNPNYNPAGSTFSPFKINGIGDNRVSYVNVGQTGTPLCWWKKNTTAQQWLAVSAAIWVNSVQIQVYPAYASAGAGQNAHTFSDDQIPVTYVRVPTYYGGMGYKGMSSLVNMNSAQHPIGTALSVQTNRDRFCVGNFSLPWDGSAPIV